MTTRKRSHAVPAAARPDWRARWERMKTDAAQDAWIWIMRHPGQRLYLYYRPADGSHWGTFHLVPEVDLGGQAGLLPVSPEPVPLRDPAGIRYWLGEYAQSLPMLGAEPD